ncbi:MAG: hypothetical protein GWO21_01930 [Gammaproteobacteria bacterium]|nr:hypothetical protein [Gammaproteobacteria bacterium]
MREDATARVLVRVATQSVSGYRDPIPAAEPKVIGLPSESVIGFTPEW